MADSQDPASARIELAKSLLGHLEAGNDEGAVSVIAQLAGLRDSLLFQEVGRLTRELHDAIKDFVKDAGLVDIAHHEMPDAAERLRYVIATTEKAANTTLGAVEDSLPLADSLRDDARRLAAQWAKFNSRQLTVEDFRELSMQLSDFLHATQSNSERLHQKMSEVVLAQGYQDITGQIIRKVIDLVDDVEGKLVELVRLSGNRVQPVDGSAAPLRKTAPQGPVVPGVDRGDIVDGQDDVDELLSSLGF